MILNTRLLRKPAEFEDTPCSVDKIIELSGDEFNALYMKPLSDYGFIAENADWMSVDNDNIHHSLLVLGEGYDDGILVHSSGADYARYAALIPNARQIVFMEQRYNCIQDLESCLTGAVDEITSCAHAYNGEGPYRVLISDLMEQHLFDERYIPLLTEMLGEHSGLEFEIDKDEILLYTNYRQEEKQTQTKTLPAPSPLPYSADRMGRLLDKALDWIGRLECGAELYNTLVEQLGMSDEEISAAGFDTLSEYFYDPTEDNNMKLE